MLSFTELLFDFYALTINIGILHTLLDDIWNNACLCVLAGKQKKTPTNKQINKKQHTLQYSYSDKAFSMQAY